MPPQLAADQEAPTMALRGAEFAALMARFAPFEDAPHLAVGVSGGADSLALALLAQDWVRAHGGQITALTVDHGLRAESAAEAAQVGGWLRRHGIAHVVLPWIGPKPTSAIQAQARAVRRALLSAWCHEARVLHLLLAHQRDDQAETVLLRQDHGSGPDGLAAMAAIVEWPELRVLRPLLGVPHAVLKATLKLRGQAWVEDPSNDNPAFARVRVRQALDERRAALVATEADSAGRRRAANDAQIARLLAQCATVYPTGWACLAGAALADADPALSRAALARVLRTIGGNGYAPRGERLDRLHAALRAGELGGGRTLGGCRVVPWRDRILVAREPAAAAEIALRAPGAVHWDGRFMVRLAGALPETRNLRLGPLGEAGWAELARRHKPARALPIPHLARLALPAVKDLDGLVAVPHLLYRRPGADPVSVDLECAYFRPFHPLGGPEFATF